MDPCSLNYWRYCLLLLTYISSGPAVSRLRGAVTLVDHYLNWRLKYVYLLCMSKRECLLIKFILSILVRFGMCIEIKSAQNENDLQ